MEKNGIQDLGGSLPLPPPPEGVPTGVKPERPLPPPPEVVPPDVKPERVDHYPVKRVMISRPGFGSSGRRIQLEANHFKVSVNSPDETFYQYSVRLSNFGYLLLHLNN